jgi:hypothetical protein
MEPQHTMQMHDTSTLPVAGLVAAVFTVFVAAKVAGVIRSPWLAASAMLGIS